VSEYQHTRELISAGKSSHKHNNRSLESLTVTLNWLGLLARREGRLEEALRYGEESLALRERLQSEYEIGLTLIDLGATYFAL